MIKLKVCFTSSRRPVGSNSVDTIHALGIKTDRFQAYSKVYKVSVHKYVGEKRSEKIKAPPCIAMEEGGGESVTEHRHRYAQDINS